MNFNNYSNQPVRDFLDKFDTEEDRAWVKAIIGLLKDIFPKLDHYVTGGFDKSYIDIRIGRKDKIVKKGSPIFFIGKESKNNGGGASLWIHENMRHILPKNQEGWIKQQKHTDIQAREWLEAIKNYVESENIKDLDLGNGYSPKDYKEQEVNVSMSNDIQEYNVPLNTILYGSPGTGKTYHTINKALEILDRSFFQANFGERSKLKKRFDELLREGKIALTTFHQSFSYEDFVEGLRAEAVDGHISYFIERGVFLDICREAGKVVADNKISELLEELKRRCFDSSMEMKTQQGNVFQVSYFGKSTFRVRPKARIKNFSKDNGWPVSIDNIENFYKNENAKIYNHSYVKAILEYMKKEMGLLDYIEENSASEKKPYVLIIDEINRGNIANIFGELITLIEPSKRAGAPEGLSVILPYSKKEFSIPDNLYIIGTMNTADRSLALMDTALRRRFYFEEMMPKPELLRGIVVDGVNIELLLNRMNKRVTALYDRDHTLGHAFFMSLTSESPLAKLREVFERQILPLLQEYFFEDWNKIRLIVGNALIVEESMETDLFESNADGLVNLKSYRINLDALDDPQTYIRIYDKAAKADT